MPYLWKWVGGKQGYETYYQHPSGVIVRARNRYRLYLIDVA